MKERECLLIKGPSGSGKSSLLMCLIGVITDYNGSIKWGNEDIKNLTIENFRQKVGYLGPEPYLKKELYMKILHSD